MITVTLWMDDMNTGTVWTDDASRELERMWRSEGIEWFPPFPEHITAWPLGIKEQQGDILVRLEENDMAP